MTISIWYVAYTLLVTGIAYFFVDRYKKKISQMQATASANQSEANHSVKSFSDKLNETLNELVELKTNFALKAKELDEKVQLLSDATSQNTDLTALVEQLNNNAAEADAKTAEAKEEVIRLTETFADFRKQIRNNTDLELSTTEQIIDELQKRKSGKFLMLVPEVINSPDGEMVSVTVKTIVCGLKKHQVLFVLKSTLQSIGPPSGYDDGSPDWGNNPYSSDDDEDDDE